MTALGECQAAAGFDLSAAEGIVIPAGGKVRILLIKGALF